MAISVRKLKQQASLAVRGGDFAEAIAIYERLEQIEPASPLWPQRRADACRELGSWRDEFAALEHALDLTIDAGEIIQAISICKQILEIDPEHTETQERLHLLYSEPAPPSASSPAASPRPVDPPRPASRPGVSPPPLEEVLLTEELTVVEPADHDVDENDISEIVLDDPGPEHGSPAGLDEEEEREVEEEGPEVQASNLLQEQLRRTPLFGSLEAASLRHLIERVRLVRLEEGQNLFRQGERADCLYVVAEGAVVPIAEDEHRKKLAVLEAGAFFGEIGLVTNQPRNATIQAIVSTKLLAIDRATVWEMIREDRQVLRILVRFLRDRLIDRLVRTSPFFAPFPNDKRSSVAKLFRFLEAGDGSVLIEQGRQASDLFALVAGQARVVHSGSEGEKTLATLGPGDLCGEISLLRREPAMASVVASGKCWLVALSEQRLLRLVENNPGVQRVVEELVAERSRDSRQTLRDLHGGGSP